MKSEEIIAGIDLGTTNSLIGVVESGFPIVLADQNGSRICPSVVHYGKDGTITVGEEAQRARALHPERTVTSAKRLIGQTMDTLSEEALADLAFSVKSDSSNRPLIEIDESVSVTPIDVSTEILRHLKSVAEEALETSINRAVITVPAYFNNAQREDTKLAGENAGFVVERIINEPTAAALAYGLDHLDEESTVAVYDFGGGTFDLSILQMREGLFEVISTAGDTRLGGDDIDIALARFLIKKMGISESEASSGFDQILTLAQEGKEQLSSAESFTARLPFFQGKDSYETEISRAEFEALILPILEKTHRICKRAFAEAATKGTDQIDHLILVGGSTRIPLVREKIQEWFAKEPNLSQHPDEAIALGATIQAGILCGRVRNIVLIDVTPLSLGIETFGGLMNVIIPRNSTIPAKAGELFTNAVSNQKSMAINVLQGEREMARDNWALGEVEVPFEPGPKGSARVGVQFSIDQNGILEVLARDTQTGKDHILEIRDSAVDVEDEAVEKMVSESIDHAFDDMNERIWTEAVLKSEELLPAVDEALQLAGNHLLPEEIQKIQQAADTVRKVLSNQAEKDVNALKAANQELDESTQSLASTLVDLAFSESFEETS